jgi:hypothetical protein
MGFQEWVSAQPRGVLKRLERELRIGYTTLGCVKNGRPASPRVAALLFTATGGACSVNELLYPPDAPVDKRARLPAPRARGERGARSAAAR